MSLIIFITTYQTTRPHIPEDSNVDSDFDFINSYGGNFGTGGSFLGVKRPGREADHSPPASVEVKKMWIYTSTQPIRLHGVVLN
jgi:hypothetical protein